MSNEKKKIHFNFIDILIVLFFVVIVVGFTYYTSGSWQTNMPSKTNTAQSKVRYTLTADNLSPEVAAAIKEGDVVRDAAKDTVKGTIVQVVSVDKYLRNVLDEKNDVFVQAEHPENYTVVLIIESAYTLNGNTAMIDDAEIKVGKKVHYKAHDYAFEAYITEVEK